ncbi:MAG: hypothetical protein CVT89_03150, partial [Candidatus Altiarchaeales archaeon HGW-Altiarchaeales-2]
MNICTFSLMNFNFMYKFISIYYIYLNLIKFILTMDKKYVKDYLHTDIIIVKPKFTVEEVERMVLKYQHVGFPVVENEKLVGFIS